MCDYPVPDSEYEKRLEFGRQREELVEKKLKRKGYRTKLNVTLNSKGEEVYQIFVYKGWFHSNPDFIIEISEYRTVVKKFIEVKSHRKFYTNDNSFAPKDELLQDKEYVYIPMKKFNSYKLKHELSDIAIDIFFLIGVQCEDSQWFWCDIDALDSCKIEIKGKPFGEKGGYCEMYFWDKESLYPFTDEWNIYSK